MASELDEKRVKREQQQKQDRFRGVFLDSPGGRSVFADLRGYCGMDRTTFSPGMPDVSAFQEGARAVFLEIVRVINYDLAELEQKLKDSG